MKVSRKTKITIAPFNNWKDWFLLEKDKTKNVHKTPYKIFCGSILIDEGLVPINFESISCEFKIEYESVIPTSIDHMLILIPEMNLKKKSDVRGGGLVSKGDTINSDFTFTIQR